MRTIPLRKQLTEIDFMSLIDQDQKMQASRRLKESNQLILLATGKWNQMKADIIYLLTGDY